MDMHKDSALDRLQTLQCSFSSSVIIFELKEAVIENVNEFSNRKVYTGREPAGRILFGVYPEA
jgi:hypothetical protein